MKYRLLVINGQRIIQTKQEGAWKNLRIDRSGVLKPGIYNLQIALKVERAKKR